MSIALSRLGTRGIVPASLAIAGTAAVLYLGAAFGRSGGEGLRCLLRPWRAGTGPLVLAVSAMTCGVHLGLASLGGSRPSADVWGMTVVAVFQLLAVVLPEEALFRGTLQEALRTAFPTRPAVVPVCLTAALFTLAHVPTAFDAHAVLLLLVALVLGWLKERADSVWAPVTWHLVLNLLGALAPLSL